jgi:hypothetical protein
MNLAKRIFPGPLGAPCVLLLALMGCATPGASADPQDGFWAALSSHCGKASWDRSRTWLITRTAAGLRLKHDHRHADGSSDPVTLYGGDTADRGSARAQSFPVDADSIAMFTRDGLAASVTNIWTVEVDPAGTAGATYAYQLQRTVAGGAPAERHFRVVFDLTQPIPLPPPAWGWE